MRLSRRADLNLRGLSGLTLAFIYIPLLIIFIYAFNTSKVLEWPPPGLTLEWFGDALTNEGARDAFLLSLRVAALATIVALILGTLASMAVGTLFF